MDIIDTMASMRRHHKEADQTEAPKTIAGGSLREKEEAITDRLRSEHDREREDFERYNGGTDRAIVGSSEWARRKKY